MTDPAAAWLQGNDAYLGTALAWLHLRLNRLALSGREIELAVPLRPPAAAPAAAATPGASEPGAAGAGAPEPPGSGALSLIHI